MESWVHLAAAATLALLLGPCNSGNHSDADEKELPKELAALLAIKAELRNVEETLSDWQAPVTPAGQWCAWWGVSCNSHGAVQALDLSKRNLSGTISESVEQLTCLVALNVSGNQLAGPLPRSFTNLTSLEYLDISRNFFNGSVPSEIFHLKRLLNFTAYSNSFSGPLPLEFVHLPLLERLDLSGSYFTGPIPPEYGSLTALRYLDLSGNLLNGSLPPQLGNLPVVRFLKLGWNDFSGRIPPNLGNLSASLEYLDLAGAHLSGSIPSEFGRLSRLSTLFLYQNQLSSSVPPEIGNLTALLSLDLSQNSLSGHLPCSLSNLHSLTLLSLMYNNLTGPIPAGIAGLNSLRTLLVWNNSFSGSLPQQLGANSPLSWFDASANRLSGHIPSKLCSGGKLFKLMLFSNKISGTIPSSLAHCKSLWRLRLEDNQLTGFIPAGFGLLRNFTYLDVSHNLHAGPLPEDLLTSPFLQFLDISHNPIASIVPSSVWMASSLQTLYASSCNLSGTISSIIQCPPLITLDLSQNQLSGSIPPGMGLCQKLIFLNLSTNQLTSQIPVELTKLSVLSTLDISHNSLTGHIPVDFENATALEVLDVSYNHLSGMLPLGGLFKIINPAMLAGNRGLCGGILGVCTAGATHLANAKSADISLEDASRKKTNLGAIIWVVGAILAMTVIILLASLRFFYIRLRWWLWCCKCKRSQQQGAWRLTAFQRLAFNIDDILCCLVSDNIIGVGAAGTVYRADMPSGEVLAVKKLWGRQKEGETRGHHANKVGEVEVLGSVRHRNIVRLLGCLRSEDTTLLIYEYMPNGSLGDLLHGNNKATALDDWVIRYKIAMGVAQGLCYLHHDCFPVVVHRDVKSNNILLDANMEARVADFGVAKIIESTESMSVVAGSYGYIAPEYAYTMQVDEKSDIYSFGVVLLELLTGKRPGEPEFGDAGNIVDWVREKMKSIDEACNDADTRSTAMYNRKKYDADDAKSNVEEVLDARMGAAISVQWTREEMMLVVRLALLCTSNSPADRPSMRDVVTMLFEAKPRQKNKSTSS